MELNINVGVIASWVGHKDGGALILKRYSHVRPAHAAEMAERVTFSNPEPQAVVAAWQSNKLFHAPRKRGFFVSSNSERIFGIALKKCFHILARYQHAAKLCASAQVTFVNVSPDSLLTHSQARCRFCQGVCQGREAIQNCIIFLWLNCGGVHSTSLGNISFYVKKISLQQAIDVLLVCNFNFI